MAGQTLSLRCQYPPKNGPYERKGWCKEVSELLCTGLVTSSRPHMLAQASRFSIWDSPSSGFFVVTMTGLREEDTGHYWCRIYPTSGHSVSKSVRFHLAVSPGEALAWGPLAPRRCLLVAWLWKPGCPPPALSPGKGCRDKCPGDSHVHTHVHPLHALSG